MTVFFPFTLPIFEFADAAPAAPPMAELSFGHNLRAKRKEVVNNTLSFLPWAQGCLTACAPADTPSSLESGAPSRL